jgi:hypothetical protein
MRRFALPGLLSGLLFLGAPAQAQDFPTPEQVMEGIDTNRDGGVDRAEWAASPAPVPFPDMGDTNMDGKIDLAELTELFRAFQAANGGAPPPPPPQPQPAPQG